MSISAAPAYESTPIANDFAGLAAVPRVSTGPLKAFDAKAPAQIQRQKFQVVGAKTQIDKAVSGVFDAHKKASRRFGLMGAERGKSANIINPPKDIMLMATAAVLPVFAPVASALAISSILNYVNADRKGYGKGQLQARLEDEVRSTFQSRSSIFDVDWSNYGYHAANKAANDEPGLSLEEFEFLSRPPEDNYDMQILLGQRTQIRSVDAANQNRAIKGVPVSDESVDMAIDMDSKRLYEHNRAHLNLSGLTM